MATFTVSVFRIADDQPPPAAPTNLEWYAVVTVHKKDGPYNCKGTGATSAAALQAAFTGARDNEVRAAIEELKAALG